MRDMRRSIGGEHAFVLREVPATGASDDFGCAEDKLRSVLGRTSPRRRRLNGLLHPQAALEAATRRWRSG